MQEYLNQRLKYWDDQLAQLADDSLSRRYLAAAIQRRFFPE